VGTLCDRVAVCARDADEASRIMEASSRFDCRESDVPGCSGFDCVYRSPGVIDAAEFAEICAVTLLTPTPHIACVVYGP